MSPAATGAHNVRRGRPLLLLERTMYREGLTAFASVFTIRLLGEIEEVRLQQALARVQAKHPLLRCVVENDGSGPSFVLLERPAPIPLRLVQRSSDDDWQTEARREWTTPFEGECKPLVRVVWLRGGAVNELLLIGHHCICDGQTGITLLRDCLNAYEHPERDLGSYDGLGAMEDIVPAALLQDRSFQRTVRWKSGFVLRLILFLKQRAARPSSGPPIAADQMYFHRWEIGTASSLTERCKSEGVTVLAAVSVAFMQAFRDVLGRRGMKKAFTMVNARRFMPEMPAEMMFGLAPGVALRTKGLPPPQDISPDGFWLRAQAVKAELTRRIDRLAAGWFANLVGLEGLHDKYASLVVFFEGMPAVRHLTLSNMGRLHFPRDYQSFRLQKVYSPLVMVSPTPANTVVISNFAGEMEFAIVSDEQSPPHAQALQIKDRAMEILRACVAAPAQYRAGLAGEPSATRAETT